MPRLSTKDLAKAKELAGKVSQHHAQAKKVQEGYLKAQKEYLSHAIEAGGYLDDLWDLLGKGRYGKFRDQHLPDVGERMCRYYREARHLYRDLGLEPATIAGSDFTITGFIKWAKSEPIRTKRATRTNSRLTSSGRRVSATPGPRSGRTSSGRPIPTPENSNPVVKAYRPASKEQRDEFHKWLPKHSRYKVVPQ
jgi:hypothetical protein